MKYSTQRGDEGPAEGGGRRMRKMSKSDEYLRGRLGSSVRGMSRGWLACFWLGEGVNDGAINWQETESWESLGGEDNEFCF